MNSEGSFICGVIVGVGVMLLVLMQIMDISVPHKELVQTGHGEYVITDPMTGELEFQLKEMK